MILENLGLTFKPSTRKPVWLRHNDPEGTAYDYINLLWIVATGKFPDTMLSRERLYLFHNGHYSWYTFAGYTGPEAMLTKPQGHLKLVLPVLQDLFGESMSDIATGLRSMGAHNRLADLFDRLEPHHDSAYVTIDLSKDFPIMTVPEVLAWIHHISESIQSTIETSNAEEEEYYDDEGSSDEDDDETF